MHFDENTKLGRATVLCNRWIRFWVKGKGIYRKILEWVIKGSKHSVGYLSTGLCNNSSSCKEKTVAVQDSSGLLLETLPLRSLHHEGLPLETTQPQWPILPPLAWVNSGGQASPAMVQTPKVLCLLAGPSADLENRCDHSCFLGLHYHA